MKRFRISLNYSEEIDAEDRDDALRIFWEQFEMSPVKDYPDVEELEA